MIVSPDVVTIGALPQAAFSAYRPIIAAASMVGARIRTKEAADALDVIGAASAEGLVYAFRFGVIVVLGAHAGAIARVADACAPFIDEPTALGEAESCAIAVVPGQGDRVDPEGRIELEAADPARLMLVATVLARSAVLDRDEAMVAAAFEASAPVVEDLRANGRVRLPIRAVMRLVGGVLAARHRVTGLVEVAERPDVLWDNPQLDRLYARLENEYELRERARGLDRKFAALGDFADTLVEVVQDKRAVRLEAAIIALFAFEIVLNLFGALR